MKAKRLLSVALAGVITIGMLAGCGSKESGETDGNSKDGSEGQVTVTYWGWENANYMKPVAEAFMESHPNIKIELTDVAYSDLFTKVQQALASGGELPTIVPMNSTLAENFKELDMLEDLTQEPYNVKAEEWVDYIVKRNTTEDGKLIGVGENVTPAGIAYKRDLAIKYFGTDDPDELYDMFQTYDDYIEKGKEVNEKSGGKDFLFHSGGAVAEWIYFADQTEVQEGNTVNYSEKMKNVMDVLCEMRDNNVVDTFQNGTPQANATYADDNHIFYPCPDWVVSYYITPNDPDGSGNWGIMKAPGGAYSAGGTSMGITASATAEQKEAAWEFLAWLLTTDEGVQTAKDAAGYMTTYKKYCEDESVVSNESEFFGGQDIGKFFYIDVLPECKIPNTSVYEQTIIDIRDLLATAVMSDTSMTAEDAVEQGLEECHNRITDEGITIE